jgi:hypothetical protein
MAARLRAVGHRNQATQAPRRNSLINSADPLIGMWERRAAFPQKEKLINLSLQRSLRLGSTAFASPKQFGAERWRVGVQPPEIFPFIPIYSHDLAGSLPCPSRAAGQPRSRAENRVSSQQEPRRRDAAVVIRHVPKTVVVTRVPIRGRRYSTVLDDCSSYDFFYTLRLE